jgi:5-formyltetrahydrofolate cyclo-ligase
MTKQELRQLMRVRKEQFLPCSFTQKEPSLLCKNRHVAHAHTLLLYSALPDEVPTQPLTDLLVSQGKTVLLPKVVSETEMELRQYTGQHDLQQGAFGIMEPVGQLFTDYRQIDVAIIPGVAFDQQGHRLGRGRGYYDRFLAQVPLLYKIGLCFSWQIVGNVPADKHDVVMDEVFAVTTQTARL